MLVACGAACLLFAQGCAAVQATQQPGKKKMSVLNPGTQRTRVIAEFGAPLWSEDRDEGTTVDVFAFKQGYSKGIKASRALVHGAADVVTGGLWEVVGIPAESLANGKDVKLEVTYDDRKTVRNVEVFEGEEAVSPRGLFGRRKPSSKQSPESVAEKPTPKLN